MSAPVALIEPLADKLGAAIGALTHIQEIVNGEAGTQVVPGTEER